jgi:hypothetical protein
MNVYKYVAESNPNGAVQIINSFGYEVANTSDLGRSLSELVAEVGEPAFKKVMENHPDKDVILELYSNEKNNNDDKKEKSCGCKACRNNNNGDEYLQYLNLSGSGKFADEKSSNSNTNTHLLANQTNVILVVSALFIATALILKK